MFILYINLPYLQGSYKTGFYTYLQKLPTSLLHNKLRKCTELKLKNISFIQLKELKNSYLLCKK